MNAAQQTQDIAPDCQPVNRRQFRWEDRNRLQIIDWPEKSPQQHVTWSLHVLANDIQQIAVDRFVLTLAQSRRRLTLTCPLAPLKITYHQHNPTRGLTLVYPEQCLEHQLAIEDTPS